MQHGAEMQIYKEILDKMRQLMAMEGQEEEEGIEGEALQVFLAERGVLGLGLAH